MKPEQVTAAYASALLGQPNASGSAQIPRAKLRSLALAAFALIGAAGCAARGANSPNGGPGSPEGIMPEGKLIYQHHRSLSPRNLQNGKRPWHAETASVVVAPKLPGSHCPAGRVFLGYGSPREPNRSRLQMIDIPCLQNPSQCRGSGSPYRIVDHVGDLPREPIPDWDPSCGQAPNRYIASHIDMSLARAGTDGVVYLFPSVERRVHPKKNCKSENWKVVNLVQVSHDCGTRWSPPVSIDATKLPRTPEGDKLLQGMDMPNLYTDPFSSGSGQMAASVYLAGSDGHRPLREGSTSQTVIYHSRDSGHHWEFRGLLRDEQGKRVLINNTQSLTTTEDGTFFVFGCQFTGNYPRPATLAWSYDRGRSFHTFDAAGRPKSVTGAPKGCHTLLKVNGLFPGNPVRNIVNVSVTRVAAGLAPPGYVAVRVAYPITEYFPNRGNVQSLRVATVAVPKARTPGKAHVLAEHFVRSPRGHIFHPRMIQPEFLGPKAPGSKVEDTTLLYWQEVELLGRKHRLMYQLVRDRGNWSPPALLSQEFGHEIHFSPPRNKFLGDWDKGSFVAGARPARFFVNWSEAIRSHFGTESRLFFNVVEAPP